MSETQTRQQQPQQAQGKKLALAELQTVKWVASQPTIKGTYDTVKPRYMDLKQVPVIGWIIAFYEMVVVTVWNFVHNLPWPQVVLSLLDRMDAAALRLIDYTQLKLEWWWDATGVRLMWLRESILGALDRYVTFIDKYLLWFQDATIAFVSALLRPVTVLYKFITAPTRTKEQQKQQQRKSGAVKSLVEDNGEIAEGGRQRGSTDLDSDMAEDDDDTEDFPSDASEDSTKRKQGSGKGKLRKANNGASNGTLRRLFPGLLSKVGKGTRDSGVDDAPAGGMEQRETSSRESSGSRSGSLRRLPRLFTSSSERKEESANSLDEVGKSSASVSKPSLHSTLSPAKSVISPTAVIRASTVSPTGSPGESPGSSPEGRRRGFGRFSSKGQRSRK